MYHISLYPDGSIADFHVVNASCHKEDVMKAHVYDFDALDPHHHLYDDGLMFTSRIRSGKQTFPG